MEKSKLPKPHREKTTEYFIQLGHEHEKRVRPQIHCGESMTEQAHKKECDMNHILREYSRTGLIKHAKQYEGRYDDVPVSDFQEAMFLIKNAENMFNALPGSVRAAMDNDPAKFLEFVQNPANEDKMRELGILRGNDGIDIKGAPSRAPVEKPVISENTPKTTKKDTAEGV